MEKWLLVGVYEPNYASPIGLELKTKRNAESAKRWMGAGSGTYLLCLPIQDRPGWVRDPQSAEILELKNKIFTKEAWTKFIQEVWG